MGLVLAKCHQALMDHKVKGLKIVEAKQATQIPTKPFSFRQTELIIRFTSMEMVSTEEELTCTINSITSNKIGNTEMSMVMKSQSWMRMANHCHLQMKSKM